MNQRKKWNKKEISLECEDNRNNQRERTREKEGVKKEERKNK